MDNFVAVTFASADDADKAYYDLKGNGYGPGYDVIQGALVVRDAEGLRISDHFESDWLDDDRYEDVVEKVVKARQDVCKVEDGAPAPSAAMAVPIMDLFPKDSTTLLALVIEDNDDRAFDAFFVGMDVKIGRWSYEDAKEAVKEAKKFARQERRHGA